MEDKERLKQLALELREIWKENRKSKSSSKFETFFEYILNEDLYKSVRKRLLKNLIEYQYVIGKCRGKDIFLGDEL